MYLVLLVDNDGKEHAYTAIEAVNPLLKSCLQALATEKKCRVVARRLISNIVDHTTEEFCFEP